MFEDLVCLELGTSRTILWFDAFNHSLGDDPIPKGMVILASRRECSRQSTHGYFERRSKGGIYEKHQIRRPMVSHDILRTGTSLKSLLDRHLE